MSDEIIEFGDMKQAVLICSVVFILGLFIGGISVKVHFDNQSQPTESQVEYFDSVIMDLPVWAPPSMTLGQFQSRYLSYPHFGIEYVKPYITEICKRQESVE